MIEKEIRRRERKTKTNKNKQKQTKKQKQRTKNKEQLCRGLSFTYLTSFPHSSFFTIIIKKTQKFNLSIHTLYYLHVPLISVNQRYETFRLHHVYLHIQSLSKDNQVLRVFGIIR